MQHEPRAPFCQMTGLLPPIFRVRLPDANGKADEERVTCRGRL
jgi:hypothetical protein